MHFLMCFFHIGFQTDGRQSWRGSQCCSRWSYVNMGGGMNVIPGLRSPPIFVLCTLQSGMVRIHFKSPCMSPSHMNIYFPLHVPLFLAHFFMITVYWCIIPYNQ